MDRTKFGIRPAGVILYEGDGWQIIQTSKKFNPIGKGHLLNIKIVSQNEEYTFNIVSNSNELSSIARKLFDNLNLGNFSYIKKNPDAKHQELINLIRQAFTEPPDPVNNYW